MKIKTLVLALGLCCLLFAMPTKAQELSRVKELMSELSAEIEKLEAQGVTPTPQTTTPTTTTTSTETSTVALDKFPDEVTDPEHIAQIANDEQNRVESVKVPGVVEPIDTLPSASDKVSIILYNDNTWRYVRNRAAEKDNEIYASYWDTINLFPYSSVPLAQFPEAMAIDLVDSLKAYHYPYKGTIKSYGKFGPRKGRPHRGIDLTLTTGDPIYATFNGKVRISKYNSGGYGNLVVIRHDNGLETFYGHLSKRLVTAGQWVEAGQIIGLGGSTGRSTGPHLHYETRYYGQTFDPERLIDFETGDLRRETIVLKRLYFDIHANASQDFEDEIALEEEIKRKKAEAAQKQYHKVRSGDTLGAIARKYGTTVTKICQLNGIKSTTILQLGRSLRVR